MPAASTGTNKAELLRLQQELTAKMLEYTQVWLLFLVPFQTLFTWLFFRRSGYNLAETFVLICYVSVFQNLVHIPFVLISYLTGGEFISPLFMTSAILSVCYSFYAVADVYQQRTVTGWLKSVSSYTVAFLCYLVVFILVARQLAFSILEQHQH